jgi:hypothetical protein
MLRKFVIERDIAGVGALTQPQLAGAAQTSCAALTQLGPNVQWVQSYVAKDKTFCIYLAQDEAAILEHARISGFPANIITEITTIIDPTTARG